MAPSPTLLLNPLLTKNPGGVFTNIKQILLLHCFTPFQRNPAFFPWSSKGLDDLTSVLLCRLTPSFFPRYSFCPGHLASFLSARLPNAFPLTGFCSGCFWAWNAALSSSHAGYSSSFRSQVRCHFLREASEQHSLTRLSSVTFSSSLVYFPHKNSN